MKPTVFIDGEAGTTGLQIKERLEGRDDIALLSIAPDKRKDTAERSRLLNAADLVVLCLPDDAAREAVTLIENPAVRVIDASTAHRVHPEWEYGFPEMTEGQADRIRASKRVANPGCWATAMIALIRPLTDAGILPPDYPLMVGGVSGYSGGGRSMIESFEGAGPNPTSDAYRLYALGLDHKHLPEMRTYGGLARAPLFTPGVGRFRQGMLVQIGLRNDLLALGTNAARLHDLLQARYALCRHIKVQDFAPGKPFVMELQPEALNGTNDLEIFVFASADGAQTLLVARLDNLGKGASGAAAQNLNLMLGLNEK